MKLNENIITEKQDGKFIIYNIDNGDFFETSKIGETIINNIEKKIDEIIDIILKKTTCKDINLVTKETESFIAELKTNKLIRD